MLVLVLILLLAAVFGVLGAVLKAVAFLVITAVLTVTVLAALAWWGFQASDPRVPGRVRPADHRAAGHPLSRERGAARPRAPAAARRPVLISRDGFALPSSRPDPDTPAERTRPHPAGCRATDPRRRDGRPPRAPARRATPPGSAVVRAATSPRARRPASRSTRRRGPAPSRRGCARPASSGIAPCPENPMPACTLPGSSVRKNGRNVAVWSIGPPHAWVNRMPSSCGKSQSSPRAAASATRWSCEAARPLPCHRTRRSGRRRRSRCVRRRSDAGSTRLPPVADAHLRRPTDLLEAVGDRLGCDQVVRDHAEAAAKPGQPAAHAPIASTTARAFTAPWVVRTTDGRERSSPVIAVRSKMWTPRSSATRRRPRASRAELDDGAVGTEPRLGESG